MSVTTDTSAPSTTGRSAAARPSIAGAVESSDKVASHLHPEGSFLVDDHPMPTGLEEIWRFTPLKRLRNLHKDAELVAGGCDLRAELADGVTLREVAADDAVVGSSGYRPSDRVSARAWAAASTATVLTIPTDTVVEGASFLTYRGLGSPTATAGHTVIVAEPFSKATVVLRFEGSAVLADNIEIVVGDSAQLTVVSIEDWADDAVHHSTQHARVGRDAGVRHLAVSFGGDLVRMNTSVAYDGPGGQAELLGLYFADAGQHLEHRLFVDHNAPKTRSNVDYKGALQGAGAHSVWIGDVLIRKVAEGIETYESNRNLVLTDGCRADSVPNLEIETGEIAGAGHASTTGRFDDEQLFYLRSRGIDEEEARRLVVHGFFADIIKRIAVPEIEQHLLDAVEAELRQTVGVPAVEVSA
ncbi:Fe-S cluster assembly protein SufD [Microlunatus panaciterrae]|uniref:Fe-S cluster assembly protein SufD n=1 Tax=Microlunatus panaciterrae TaxID=400768 RepID=A0ABS2RMM8_9ACTN|nr:Fe-S cluster assembly protein SufD [Microlunatus panaciterrae]MBM7800259.1 Fe-S cluster assembly protein SufD [Microlunatus panaciterrae]